MITLISRWKLKDGCPPALDAALKRVAAEVREKEPDTWMYLVHLPAQAPLDRERRPIEPPPPPIPLSDQREVVFIEAYKDAEAFAYHVDGPTFTSFRKANIGYFVEDPPGSGWPKTENTFLERESAFIRRKAGGPRDREGGKGAE